MCECDRQMGKLPYLVDTRVYPEVDITGDMVIIDSVSGEPVRILETEASETTEQSNWIPILILTGIGLLALRGMR